MGNERNPMQRYAMLLGTYMGVFWILKFMLIPLGMTTGFLMMLFVGLTICVPFMAYRYAKLYRDQACGGHLSLGRAWLFTALMFGYAALLTAIGHYTYFAWIDDGYLLQTTEALWNQAETTGMQGLETYAPAVRETLALAKLLTPVDIVMQMLWQNIIYCAILAIPIALFVHRK